MSKQMTNKQTALKLLFRNAVGKLSRGKKLVMNNPRILENESLLNFVSHNVVAWTFIKIFTAYKYVGYLI